VGQGGALYNSVGFVGTGLANTCDGLLALEQAVFEDHRFEIGELIDALDADYENNERMRQYLLNRVPKWGNDEPASDELASKIADYYCDRVHTFENARGGGCQAALFSLTFAAGGGKLTGALPDGRKAGTTLAPGVGSTSGMDRSGVTALINSVSSLDFTKTPNGSVLDVTLHPSAIQGGEGLDGFVALIKTFFQQGGYAIQFNVFDIETLKDAQRNPEQYASLQIRVTGWSVYFTSLSKEEQDRFIARVTHAG
jgi:formate C-acetyltransferase